MSATAEVATEPQTTSASTTDTVSKAADRKPAAVTGKRFRGLLLALAVVRIALGMLAVVLAPALYEDHFVLLVLLRPTKDVLLAAGFLFGEGRVGIAPVLIAAIPLAIFAVWHFYWVGRCYADELSSGDGLPKWSRRVLPRKRIDALTRVLDRKGRRVIVLGRVAAFPSALLGTAAGASDMEPRKFLPSDAIGALLSITEMIVVGYAFGASYKSAGPWLTGAGIAVLFGLLFFVGHTLKREEKQPDSASE